MQNVTQCLLHLVFGSSHPQWLFPAVSVAAEGPTLGASPAPACAGAVLPIRSGEGEAVLQHPDCRSTAMVEAGTSRKALLGCRRAVGF
jgi:hypothetical protein